MCFHRREHIPSLHIQMDQSDYDWKVQQGGGGGGEKFQKQNKFPTRILQFVFSVSVVSFLLWYSFGCSLLPHDESINAFFSTFLFSIFSHVLERKYMFLLCNAILAFLAKTSLSISSDSDDESLSDTNAIPVSMVAPEEQVTDKEHVTEEEEEEDDDDDDEREDGAENIIEASSAAKEEEEDDDEQVGDTGESTEVMVGTQDEEEEDATVAAENEEISNADELNRKFEEFIRKMKEEIRIEAQSQLIPAV